MPATEKDGVRALPENTLLLHVGLPKTGTTAVQVAAATRREKLLEHGVLYPGRYMNHRWAAFAVGQRHEGWNGENTGTVPPIQAWQELVDEVAASDASRVFVSHEFFGEYDEEVCRRIVADLGRPVHVLFTLRSIPSTLGSSWQQYLKSRAATSFEEWLELVFSPGAAELDPQPRFVLRSDLSGHVEKWARVVGAENVTSIVLDPDRRALVSDTVEQLLGLPANALTAELSGQQSNRSFTFPEAEMLRRVNVELKQHPDIGWPPFSRLLRVGAMDRILAARTPDPDEQAIVPPRWAVDRALALAETHRVALSTTRTRIVGSLDNLVLDIPGAPETLVTPAQVSVAAAAEAILGVFSASLGRGPLLATPGTRDPRTSAPVTVGRTGLAPTPAPRPAPAPLSLRARTSGALARTRKESTANLALALFGRLVSVLRRSPRGGDRAGR